VRREASLGLDFTMWCTSCSRSAAEVSSERQSQLTPDGRWTIRKEAGPSGSRWHKQWRQKQLPCLVQPALSLTLTCDL
jgi:hypothetical protein